MLFVDLSKYAIMSKWLFVLVIILLCSCKSRHTYYVHIIKMNNEEHIDTIRASSDSGAYSKGYKYFKVGEYVEADIKDTIKNCTPGTYKSFTVTNQKGKNIFFHLSDKAKADLDSKAKMISGIDDPDE